MNRLSAMITLALLIFTTSVASAQAQAFQFALIGDMPYSKVEEQQFANLIDVLNTKELAFVVHVGDMELDARNYNANASFVSIPCNDEYDAWFLGMLQRIRHPVVVTLIELGRGRSGMYVGHALNDASSRRPVSARRSRRWLR